MASALKKTMCLQELSLAGTLDRQNKNLKYEVLKILIESLSVNQNL